MKIKRLIESIGLSAEEVKPYLLGEIEEFLESENHEDQLGEFHDIVFALKNIAYAHTGKHIEIDDKIYEKKMEDRLKEYGTISKKKPIYSHNCIKEVPIGLVHLSFGNFKQPWTQFDPFKNGTEAEIAMLTDNEFRNNEKFTNHIIITFDDVDQLEYSFLTSSWSEKEKNVILCRIPDFIYKRAKKSSNFREVENLLSLQVYSSLKNLNINQDCISHFHSWESALAFHSEEFKEFVKNKEKIFSPYLTVARLKEFLKENGKFETTLNKKELDLSSEYEFELIEFSDKIIVESENDKKFYEKFGGDKIKKFSYSRDKEFIVPNNGVINNELTFISGGRPVYEKGFIELIKEIPKLIEFAKSKGLKFKLKLFCKEYNRATHELKKPEYMRKLNNLIEELNLKDYVFLLDKISVNKLREEINNSSGFIVPSLYDPYCLMPHYAIDVDRISFVSKYTGISENIESREYVFDPTKEGSLLKSVKRWFEEGGDFILRNKNKSYKELYKE